MIHFQINNIDYNCPESWDDVPIDTWRNIIAYQKHLTIPEDVDDMLEYKLEYISMITRIPIEILISIPSNNLSIITGALSFINNLELSKEAKDSFIMDGEEYIFMDLKDLTLGDKASIEIIRENKDPFDVLPQIMAILYKTLEDKALLISLNVSINDVYSNYSFFLTMIELYTEHMKTYSKQEKMREMTNQQNELMKKLPWMKRIKMKLKLAKQNIITAFVIGWQKAQYKRLIRYSK
jgi:hypothetical protein